MKLGGLGRKIAVSMAELALGIMLIVVLMTYVFYYVMLRHWGEFCHQASWIPSPRVDLPGHHAADRPDTRHCRVDRLAHRILVPLNSVADGIRRVARGDLTARAVAGDRSIREAALIADDFNALAAQLQRMTDEQAFWNAAIAHELRTPVTVLRGRLQGLAEGVFQPGEALFRSLLTQAEGLTRLIEDLRVISLAESGHLSVSIQETDRRRTSRRSSRCSRIRWPRPVNTGARSRYAARALRRVPDALLALLENARRYAVPGAIRIHTRSKTVRASWWSKTKAQASPPIAQPGSSTPSGAWTIRIPTRRAAAAWGWPWWRPSRRRTTEKHRVAQPRAAARRSRCAGPTAPRRSARRHRIGRMRRSSATHPRCRPAVSLAASGRHARAPVCRPAARRTRPPPLNQAPVTRAKRTPLPPKRTSQ